MITLTSVGGGTDLGVADNAITILKDRAQPDRPSRAAARASHDRHAARPHLDARLPPGQAARAPLPQRRPPRHRAVRAREHGRRGLPPRPVRHRRRGGARARSGRGRNRPRTGRAPLGARAPAARAVRRPPAHLRAARPGGDRRPVGADVRLRRRLRGVLRPGVRRAPRADAAAAGARRRHRRLAAAARAGSPSCATGDRPPRAADRGVARARAVVAVGLRRLRGAHEPACGASVPEADRRTRADLAGTRTRRAALRAARRLERALELLPEEEDALRAALDLRARAASSPAAPLRGRCRPSRG